MLDQTGIISVMTQQTPQGLHIPVLLDQVIDILAPKPGECYFDGTAGYGGHSQVVDSLIGNSGTVFLNDRDENAHSELNKLEWQSSTRFLKNDFVTAAQTLIGEGIQVDMALLDLGVSSPQFDIASRGFSFRQDAPLDMRMDQSTGATAADIVNSYDHKELARLISNYGEDPQARRIAQTIIDNRPFNTTVELAEAIRAVSRKGSKTHPATRTFQALRIAVNDELNQVKQFLELVEGLLKPGGRLVIISFHSLEDRIVKKRIKRWLEEGYESDFTVLTKKAIKGAEYDVLNPRARSAMLRAVTKK